MYTTGLDIAYADQMFVQFNKKPKPFFGTDTNYPAVYIDKIKVIHGEVEDEM